MFPNKVTILPNLTRESAYFPNEISKFLNLYKFIFRLLKWFLSNLIHFGKTLSAEDDLNKIILGVKPAITIFTVSQDIPKNAPSGAGTYGVVITIHANRNIQIYIDYKFVKTRMSASSSITDWV